MNVVFCFDKNYEQHFGVALTSVLLNNTQDTINVHIITDIIEKELKPKLDNLSKNYKCSFFYYTVEDTEQFKDVKISGHISKAAYYRLIIPDLLPQNINKVLYLDSDLVVISSLEELYQVNLNDYFLAAQGSRKTGYFNSGVMVLNLEKWRNEKISTKVLDWARENKEKLRHWDQTALNHVIASNFVTIDRKWNTEVDLSRKKTKNLNSNSSFDSVKIVHFVGSRKPWYFWVSDKRKDIYNDYLEKSLWSKPKLQKIFQQIGYILKKL
ncbi:MAG: glycosyltransferase family 8 protein [Crocosphaera sp.]|uniref:glycosyltransferase family 8 protein n=1 Tax=Crocosphaera sp. TaxID=2729996 RepID=UPI002579B822|nr:glycosyltransferase family 8 protein [Crocosphaera sp.]MCH2244852.1 glycosyltransferase family 8 protein [Crocosphaera sp.]NQZ62565.1 glycosyltransferase family 8 protein [Crocosphaera sp.]